MSPVLPEPLGVIASTIIGVTFVVAGASKLSAVQAWKESARSMGSPTPIAAIVPWLEIVIGGLVVARIALPWSAMGLAVMLVGFTVLIVSHLFAGRRPGCGCFGEGSVVPLGPRHLIRNAVLLVIAVGAALG